MENEKGPDRADVIRTELKALAEPKVAGFSAGLLRKPGEERLTGSAARVLGVRLPVLRRISRRLAKEDWRGNLEALEKRCLGERTMRNPGAAGSSAEAGANGTAVCNTAEGAAEAEAPFFEEILLWGFLIGCARVAEPKQKEELCREVTAGPSGRKQKSIQEAISLQEQFSLIRGFVPAIDNWSLCDSFCASLKFAGEYPAETWDFIQPFLQSEEEYSIRFGLVMIINYFITEEYVDRLYTIFDEIEHAGYYVKMAVAWAVSICYVKFPDATQLYLETNRLDDFTYNKALRKIVESRCVSDEVRARMRSMRRG